MRESFVDADIAVRDRAYEVSLPCPFSFDPDTSDDASPDGPGGKLISQNDPFLIFGTELLNSLRVGPSQVSPTRYLGDLSITYLTKNPASVVDYGVLEAVAKHFQEQTISGVRFRTFTPYPASKVESFTAYTGVINFDFELYREAQQP